MLLATASTAGTLAAEIAAVNAQIALVNTLVANNSIVTGGDLRGQDGVSGQVFTQIIQQLTVSESATVFNSMLTVLNARLTTWQAALAAM